MALTSRSDILKILHHGVVVSVQAEQAEPLNKPECILALAMSVLQGGSSGLRLANPENISLIKEHLPQVPIIGITKPVHPHADPENHVYITPSLWTAESVAQAGADIVAMDATDRPRPGGETLEDIVTAIKERFPQKLLMADVARVEEGIAAAEMGFDIIGTTLSGYTAETLGITQGNPAEEPDFELLETLAGALSVPVILEGRIWEPWHVSRAFNLGAYAVVIGSAITRPHHITRRFVQAVPSLEEVGQSAP